MPDPAPSGAAPLLCGRYRLLHRVATGAVSEVWEGRDDVLGRAVAVRLLHRSMAGDAEVAERFRKEAVVAARLVHPNIVATYDTGNEDGVPFIVMEVVRWRTLAEVMAGEAPFPPGRAAAIAAQLAEAVECAHRGGVVHGHLKPSTIFVADDDRVKVGDFGTAAVWTSGGPLDATKPIAVGVAYLAPEQRTGDDAEPRSDIYALGVILEEMAGDKPPPALATIARRARAERPEDRYPTAAALAADLRRQSSLPRRSLDGPHTPPAVAVTRPARPPARRVGVAVVIVAVVAALGIAGALVAASRPGHRTNEAAPAARPGEVPSIERAVSFDPPPGNGEEHDADLSKLYDQNPETAWTTNRYGSSHFGNLKDGVGVVIEFGRSARLGHLRVTTPTSGWTASVYISDGPKPTLAGWGAPVDTRSMSSGTQQFDLHGHRGAAVLIWITDLGPSDAVSISEVTPAP